MLSKEINILSIIEKENIPFTVNGKEIIIKCIVPNCPDKRGHLYYNIEKNLWNCFRCGNKGNIRSFIFYWNRKFNTRYKWFDFNNSNLTLNKLDKSKPVLLDLYIEKLSKTFVYLWKIPQDNLVKKYLINRGITEDKWWLFYLGMFKNTKNIFDLVIPILEDFKLVGYVVRNVKTKQFKSVGKIHNYLYNIDLAKQFPEIFIVEGCFDVMHVINAVGIFGKTISRNQLLKLATYLEPNKDIYLMLDGDTSFNERYKEALKLTGIFKNVFIVDLPEGLDPDELDDLELEKLKNVARRVL